MEVKRTNKKDIYLSILLLIDIVRRCLHSYRYVLVSNDHIISSESDTLPLLLHRFFPNPKNKFIRQTGLTTTRE
ncbi:MAG: hypothetical protein K0B81_01140 [Candidatus Cloacimonetes bacterium]|nr:hypothetical protein [Candidatus Cloacimonadota bacterium]